MTRKTTDFTFKNLEIAKIRTDGGTQTRVSLDDAHVADMVFWLSEHPQEDLPPVRVAKDDQGVYWLFAGFHRVTAYQKHGRAVIRAEVYDGSQRDAVLWSLGENASHGLKRTNADKRKAVETMLADPEWSKLSNRKIADACAVSSTFVDGIKGAMGANVCGRNSLSEKGETARQEADDGAFTEEEIEEANQFVASATSSRPDGADIPFDADDEPDPATNGKASSRATPAEPEQLKDQEGEIVPPQAAEAFAVAKLLTAICREMDGIVGRVEQITKGPGGRLIRFESFCQQMKDAKGNLWANRATHVCPYCHGKNPKCQACKGEGWVAKHIWIQAPGINGKEAGA